MWVLHEFLADCSNLRGHSGTEHHHLLLLGRCKENRLDVSAHVHFLEALVTLIEDELRAFPQIQILVSQESQHAAGSADHDMGAIILQHLLVLGNGYSSIDHAHLHICEVLCESVKFVLDLISQLPCVAEHDNLHRLFCNVCKLLQASKHEYCRLTHARLCLAKYIRAQDSLRNAFMLHFRWVFKSTIYDGTQELRFQQEVAEARCVNGSVVPLLCLCFFAILRLFLGLLLVVRILLLVKIGELLVSVGHGAVRRVGTTPALSERSRLAHKRRRAA
mmetsp:Transcript_74620/g.129468  ORF Transcript_74620/g.129468 Transcript_74620/m.129468 type:complete len:276 (-) Transcript_74620:8-835(-)